MSQGEPPEPSSARHAWGVWWAFLRLGLTSFGGPVAHLGYFRAEFVERKRWLSDQAFADLVALCQFLPGPASSQVGFAIGLARAGPLGALAALTGFTLPSALLMLLAGLGTTLLVGPAAGGVLHGLKLAAVAIVAQAVFGMARTLAPDGARAIIAVMAAGLVALIGGGFAQIAALTVGAMAGLLLCPSVARIRVDLPVRVPALVGTCSLVAFFALLFGLPLLVRATGLPAVHAADAFYRAGALVFGGGHVVLPMLQENVVQSGLVDPGRFLTGYGLAQALPGPLFAIAAFLGAILNQAPNGVAGAALALAAIFLPGLLILVGVLPFWSALSSSPPVQTAMKGVNAAVVGLLAAALYNPVWTSSVASFMDVALVIAAVVSLLVWRVHPLWIVIALGCMGLLGSLAHA